MKNVFTIFVSPESTFQRVKNTSKISWLPAMIVLIILMLFAVYFQMPLTEMMLKSNPQMTPEVYESSRTLNMISMYIVALLQPAFMLFLGGLLFMLLNLIVRGEAKYMQLVTMVAYAVLPSTVGALLTTAMLFFTDAQSITDITISLGALVQDKEGILYKVMSLINPFSIWTMILYVIGSSVMMNRPKKKVGAWIIIVWLIFAFGSLLLVNNSM